MDRTPRIATVLVVGPSELLVRFENGIEKMYNCAPLFSTPRFQVLRVPAIFRAVCVDPGGYGISWNDDVDLSEHELWTNGKPASQSPQRA